MQGQFVHILILWCHCIILFGRNNNNEVSDDQDVRNRFLFGMLLLSSKVYADESTRTERESRVASQQIDIKQWHLSVNAGIGVMTNPLHGGENLPLISAT